MAGWKLKVDNFGKIKSAEIEVAPLTLFVGDNNSGKSFLLSLLWGIGYFGISALLGEGYEKTSEYDSVEKWMRSQLEAAKREGRVIVSLEDIIHDLENILNQQLEKNKKILIQSIFNSQQVSIGKIEIEIDKVNLPKIEIVIEPNHGGGVLWTSDHLERTVVMQECAVERWADGQYKFGMLPFIYSCILQLDFKDEYIDGNVYLPAARTGFMLTKDIINKVGRRNAFNISSEREQIAPFVRPINQFLDVMGDLVSYSVGEEKNLELANDIEEYMTDGRVEINSMPNKEVEYIPDGYKKGLPLRLVSAVVTELSPLVLILKHKNSIERFYYEEPEMCLHPQLQHQMGKILCRIVNAGIGMVVTTHSDIILMHINNMLRLSNHEKKTEICKKLGYEPKDLLTSDQVKVYQLESKSRGKTVVKELQCSEYGFAVPTFNDALDKIMNEAYDIQG